jgi:hypothetical protein
MSAVRQFHSPWFTSIKFNRRRRARPSKLLRLTRLELLLHSFRVITPGGLEIPLEIQFLHEEGYAKGVVDRGESPATRRRCDPPPADHPFAGLKTIQGRRAEQDASFKRKPRGRHPGTPTERSVAFKASAHASPAPRADGSSPLAQELAVYEVETTRLPP